MLVKSLIFSVFIFSALNVKAESNIQFDLPLYDYPFNSTFNTPNYYSMRQSTALSNSFYQTAHYLIGGDYADKSKNNGMRYFLIGTFDYITMTFPLSGGWMHEEWHRAIMTRRKIKSFNDMNKFPIGESVIAVSHVSDDDLIALKRDHPAEHVRLSAAGMEAQIYQNLRLEEAHFFRDTRSMDAILLWMNNLTVTSYLMTCGSGDADKTTDEEMEDEGTSLIKRDFTGLDCTAWVYDLFKPDEPYTDRGTHPSGVGIKRYIKYSDLSSKEKNFLKMQIHLSFLNFINPFMLTLRSFGESDFRWNITVSHYLTSFGHTIDGNIFIDRNGTKILGTLHNGFNYKQYFPGATVKWIDVKVVDWADLTFSGTIWSQPKKQRFDSTSGSFLMSASAEATFRGGEKWDYYVGVESKNKGWIAGNAYLSANQSIWTGVRLDTF